jgi:hypothetical protein
MPTLLIASIPPSATAVITAVCINVLLPVSGSTAAVGVVLVDVTGVGVGVGVGVVPPPVGAEGVVQLVPIWTVCPFEFTAEPLVAPPVVVLFPSVASPLPAVWDVLYTVYTLLTQVTYVRLSLDAMQAL